MAPAAVCFEHVGQNLLVASVVLGKRAVDACDRARDGEVDLPLGAEPRGVNQ